MRGARVVAAVLMLGSLTFATRRVRADTVVLKDGKRIEGKVKVQELGKYVVVELPTGVQKTIVWDDVKEIEITPGPKDEPTPKPGADVVSTTPTLPPTKETPPKPKFKKKLDKTEVTGDATKDGVSGQWTHDCGEGDPACHEEATVKLEGGELSATYNSEEDCSSETDEVCTKKTGASASKDGLNIGYSKETAKRVTGPKRGATGFGLSANFLYGSAETFTMTGFTAGLNLRMISGGLFPGPAGGSWFGFFLEPTAQFSYNSVTTETPETCFGSGATRRCAAATTNKSSSSALMFNASAGIQWMSFGAQDKKSLQQKGFGIALGPSAGALRPLVDGAETTTTYGFTLGLLSPSYNPGTGTFTTEQLNIFILPTSKMFLLLIGMQKTWG